MTEDIGWAAVYLSGHASQFVTRTALMVDGVLVIPKEVHEEDILVILTKC